MRKAVNILGVTGSVGQSTTDVILSDPAAFEVGVVTGGRNVSLLVESARKLGARKAVIAEDGLYEELCDQLAGSGISAAAGRAAIIDAAAEPADVTMAAIVGIAGLEPIMAAIAQGRNVAIANKEPLVAAGSLVMAAAGRSGAKILPVDSEHNAIFQVFEPQNKYAIERLILTASGGPFRTWSAEAMRTATPEQAIAHPNWVMGRKISVDSASMMNKALEIIEAHYLFSMTPEKIDVLVHPQSVVHSMVEYADGSVLCQMGASDMRTPIAYALAWPDRMRTPGQRLDLQSLSSLTFEPVDRSKFAAIDLAYDCLKAGQGHCIAFNAANEVAVEAFLNNRIGFGSIIDCVSHIVDNYERNAAACGALDTLADVVACDEAVRAMTSDYITF